MVEIWKWKGRKRCEGKFVALVKKNKDLDEIRVVLKEMLELSDLVKFAKFVPLENENESVVLNAFMIVRLKMYYILTKTVK